MQLLFGAKLAFAFKFVILHTNMHCSFWVFYSGIWTYIIKGNVSDVLNDDPFYPENGGNMFAQNISNIFYYNMALQPK